MLVKDQWHERNEAVDRARREIDIVEIAEDLGIRVIGRSSSQPKALCPFHEDRTPSLVFYRGQESNQYHCFACAAHGDIFDLIKQSHDCDFAGALQWLVEKKGLVLPSRRSNGQESFSDPRRYGLFVAYQIYRKESRQEKAGCAEFAALRGFTQEFLHKAEVFYAGSLKLSNGDNSSDREISDALEAAGLLVRKRNQQPSSGAGTLPLNLPPRDFFWSPRVLFTIRDDKGNVAGFVGRSLREDDTPKYLFSPGFQRSKTLYRFDKVQKSLLETTAPVGDTVELFIVEGLLDALRLESLGLNCVAIFGSHITDDQANAVARLATRLESKGIQLAVHLFLDADNAGLRGSIASVAALLVKSAATTGFMVDVIAPPSQEGKRDPDDILRSIQNREEALQLLYAWCYSPMAATLAFAIEEGPAEIERRFSQLPPSRQMRAFREVERRLDRTQWRLIFERLSPFSRWRGINGGEDAEQPWHSRIRAFLTASAEQPRPTLDLGKAPEKDEENKLNHALVVARSSTQRRELPVDEGSWDRLNAGIDVTIPYLSQLLKEGAALDEPMIAVRVPKPNGKFRLKALPCPEFLTMQQFVLNELLRDYAESPRFREWIPAVRYTTQVDGGICETTGGLNSCGISETVSFAYQIDMDVVSGRIPPRREGMFRPYFACWKDFIDFIDRRVRACRSEIYHVARLDVRSFYDTLHRSAVIDAILPAVRNGLRELSDATENGALNCAKLFAPDVIDPDQRAGRLVDWLCDQSFNYEYENPRSGKLDKNSQGIPQGPDLSAFLANIALFPLDFALRSMVEQLDLRQQKATGENARRGAVYARYVDDIVIVALTAKDLAEMRAAIEEQLARIGLDLSPKIGPLPAMTEGQLRDWLTDKRGAALGASGPFAGPPANEPLGICEPLGDAGEIDRGKSLLLLHDSRLDPPDTNAYLLLEAVSNARRSVDLRHGDLSKAAALLWRAALTISEDPDPNGSPRHVAQRFEKLWNHTSPCSGDSGESYGDGGRAGNTFLNLLFWLDGLHKILTSRLDRSPALSSSQHERIDKLRRTVAKLVQGGLCDELSMFIPSTVIAEHQHMLDLRRLAVFAAASETDPDPSVSCIPWMQGIPSDSKARMAISIACAHKSVDLLTRSFHHDEQLNSRILYHESIARLIISERLCSASSDAATNTGASETPAIDPLEPIRKRLESLMRAEQIGAGSVLLSILNLWIPGVEYTAEDHPCAADAVAALAQLAPTNFQQLLSRREPLSRAVLGGSLTWPGRTVPVPPGLDVPGLIGIRSDGEEVTQVDMRGGDVGFYPQDLVWNSCPISDERLQWKRSVAPFTGRQLLKPLDRGDCRASKMLPWVAAAFRSLAATYDRNATTSCPPTAENLIGPDLDEPLPAEAKWEILGFQVSNSRLSGFAFIRRGRRGLVPERVTECDDYLWRIGTALADRLGRIECSDCLLQMRFLAQAHVVHNDSDWAAEAMLRFSLCRLRGRSMPPHPLARLQGSSLPATVERVLRRMEQFPASTDGLEIQRMAHLVATIAEGRAMRTRLTPSLDYTVSGGAAALLIDLVRPLFGYDEELAERLPKVSSNLPSWAPLRRPSLAWLCTAWRFEALLEDDPQQKEDLTLPAIVAGTLLLAIESQLRAQVLELWALTEVPVRLKLCDSLPSCNPGLLLHRKQEGKEASESNEGNIQFLYRKLCDSTMAGSAVGGDLSEVTVLGWSVLLEFLMRRKIRNPEVISDIDGLFEKLNKFLGTELDQGDDFPWGGLSPIIAACNAVVIEKIFKDLGRVDLATGIRVESKEAPQFVLSPRRGGSVDISIPSGSLRLESWRILLASVRNEPTNGTECFWNERDDCFWHRWSETWLEDRLVSIGVIRPRMASLASIPFGAVLDKLHQAGYATRTEALTFVAPPMKRSDRVSISGGDLIGIPAHNGVTEIAEAPKVTDSAEPAPAATSNTSVDDPVSASSRIWDSQEAFARIEQIKTASWRRRSRRSPRHARVAFFQWNVDDSYRHPVYEACAVRGEQADRAKKAKGSRQEPGSPEIWDSYGNHESCAEHRRRKLLTAALKACKEFEADILVLPEYSIRADTAVWLKDQLATLAPETSIWAGTYRNAAGSLLNLSDSIKVPEWGAVMPILLRRKGEDGPTEVSYRLKKYPSVAAKELIYPWRSAIKPMFNPLDARFDPRAYVSELICSEAFLLTSPINHIAMAREYGKMSQRFGFPGVSISDLEEQVKTDITAFSKATSLSESITPPRLILLVPAMTTRTADYSIMGQAGFLAAGITTVFCSAAGGSLRGESCVIGHDGWGREAQDERGMPKRGPYHGVSPGIFDPKDLPNHGKLGMKEQALVIADIDPVYSIEGKPRPQMLPPPLELVAHLPVIESWISDRDAYCVCDNVKNRTSEIESVVRLLLDTLEKEGVISNSAVHREPKKLVDVLKKLADLVGKKDGEGHWLHRRAEAYQSEHAATPSPWPPPCAVDWLWVDVGDQATVAYPKIEIPPYSNTPS